MNFYQLLLIMRARYRLGLIVLMLTLLTTLLVSMSLPREYTAETSVVLDVKSPDPIAGMVFSGMMAPSYMATQVDIINSERVARQVVRSLKLEQGPGVREQWLAASKGKGEMIGWLSGMLKTGLNVMPTRESNVIRIEFTATDAAFAAAAANAFAQAYIDTNIGLRAEPAQQYAQWFESQTAIQRRQLQAAQKALSDFQQQTGIVSGDERVDYETARLNDLSSQLTQAQSQGQDVKSKQRGANDTLPEVMQSPLIIQLKTDIARQESQLRELVAKTGVNHPQVRSLSAQLSDLKQTLAAETRKVRISLGTSGQISLYKEADIKAAIEVQKQKILDLKKQRDAISLLQMEVQNAQRAFDGVTQRASQSKLESQMVQTNVSVLNPASAPLLPTRPKILLNLLVSAFLGMLLGVGSILLRELLDRRVRSAEDLVLLSGAPLLGHVADASQQPASRRLRWIGRSVPSSHSLNEV
ncbi:chain length determinant protein EpsF [Craterilacuibacter sp.]|uniref:chain length determinant protein EpsF n=1 Tax=Craterilacuibacter sp. TaxID=2870909 RepID=UPI003F3B1B7C